MLAAAQPVNKRPERVPRVGLWSRVAGDAIDAALMAAAARKTVNPRGLTVAAGLALGISALDVFYAQRVERGHAHVLERAYRRLAIAGSNR